MFAKPVNDIYNISLDSSSCSYTGRQDEDEPTTEATASGSTAAVVSCRRRIQNVEEE